MSLETPQIKYHDPHVSEMEDKVDTSTRLVPSSALGKAVVHSSLTDRTTKAELDSAHSVFSINPSFVSEKPFSLVTTLIPSGPFAGRHALVIDPVPTPSRQSSFLQLAPEVRNNIYRFLLTSSRPDEVVNIMGGCLKTLKGLRGRSSTYARHLPSPNERVDVAGILSCSKLVHQEAGSILYGCNTFSVHSTSTLMTFLQAIGQYNRQRLIDIRLQQAEPSQNRRASALLADMAGLRFLELGIWAYSHMAPTIEVQSLIEMFRATFEIINTNNSVGTKASSNPVKLTGSPQCVTRIYEYSIEHSSGYFCYDEFDEDNLTYDEAVALVQAERREGKCVDRYCIMYRAFIDDFKAELQARGIVLDIALDRGCPC